MTGASNLDPMSTKRQRIAQLAARSAVMAFTSLAYFIDLDWLREAYRRTRKDGAPGVDGQTAADYEANLEANLQSLLDRFKSGTYHAPPVRRVHIPKGTGPETRPIGIPTFEDKVLQRAVVLVLEALYEQDFLDCSYGFRPGRSAHQALDALWRKLMAIGGGWIVEVDISKFFDTLDRGHLREMLRQRVRDGVLLRTIDKWLKAGVLDDGSLAHPEAGTPQGGVISPLLANVYLHYVLDTWFETEVRPRLKGHAFLIRYADDFVLGFAREEDARRVMDVLPKRFGKYGLSLHPTKTRLVRFLRPRPRLLAEEAGPSLRPETFDLLGFTHFWGRSRKGAWVVKKKTARSRLRRALRSVSQWCRAHRHDPIGAQQQTLSQKLRGHDAYYGVTGNYESLRRYHEAVTRIWRRWLSRRSQQTPTRSWFTRLLERYPLPRAVVVHSVMRRAAYG